MLHPFPPLLGFSRILASAFPLFSLGLGVSRRLPLDPGTPSSVILLYCTGTMLETCSSTLQKFVIFYILGDFEICFGFYHSFYCAVIHQCPIPEIWKPWAPFRDPQSKVWHVLNDSPLLTISLTFLSLWDRRLLLHCHLSPSSLMYA